MKKIDNIQVRFHDMPVGTLRTTPDGQLCTFEYEVSWLSEGFSISPLELPLRQGLFIAKPSPFKGNFGIFEDSMPDGYGRYLLSRTLSKHGIDDRSLTVLDRLSLVGCNGMGGLTYHPETEIEREDMTDDFDMLQQKALEVLSEKQDDDAGLLLYNSGNSGGARPKTIFSDQEGHWLIKFRHTYDSKNIGREEYKYNKTARECGIEVPDFKLIKDRYFATKRFDISTDGKRAHTATAGGLLNVAHTTPILDYSNILALTGYLTQNEQDVEQMFLRMVFNYVTDNKDDHSKNFSFLVRLNTEHGWHWRLAPAYDLTRCKDGYNGEHATSVNGSGHPVIEDFIAVASKAQITRARARQLIEQVMTNVGDLKYYSI